jgi:hypothetical protein
MHSAPSTAGLQMFLYFNTSLSFFLDGTWDRQTACKFLWNAFLWRPFYTEIVFLHLKRPEKTQ